MTMRERYTEKEIMEMRRKLAKRWNQSVSQVMDNEAVWYLDKAHALSETAPTEK